MKNEEQRAMQGSMRIILYASLAVFLVLRLSARAQDAGVSDLPERDNPKNLSEIGMFAWQRGFNYDTTVRAAARGEAKALKRFFAISKEVDGAG